MAEIPDRCPRCDVPLKLSNNGRVPGARDEPLLPAPVFYCPKCKTAWLVTRS